ncbi:MAG: hypothetical protein IPJ51_21560 [Saprospiraceae bacterium]|jgi:hypothetical protein|nr:hypothetical protein [Saprospiraceae bacterium]
MKRKNNPEWYKLIKLFKSIEPPYRITTGLTIPFLIGAYKLLNLPFSEISTLVKNIVDSEIDKFPIIQRCHVIDKHVIMVEDKAKCNREYKDFIKIKSDIGNGILLISTNTDIGKNLDQISNSLKLEYESTILREEYSWSNKNKHWRKFDEKEIELIESVKLHQKVVE